jgi:hypothetical protein
MEITLKTNIGTHTLDYYKKKYGSAGKFIFLDDFKEDGYGTAIMLGEYEWEDEVYEENGIDVYLVKDIGAKRPIVHGSNMTLDLKSGITSFN